jgi:hypothetical protein
MKMSELGIVSTFFHSDYDMYGGARRAPDRLPAHNRYFYEVWAEFICTFIGPTVPVVVVNNASPVRPDNFFSHFPNIEVIENIEVKPQGSSSSHRSNARSGIWTGFLRLKEKGVRYGAHIEQDLLIAGTDWLPDCLELLKRKKASIIGFECADLNWFATELFVADVDFWIDNQLLAPGVSSQFEGIGTEELLMAQLKKLDAGHWFTRKQTWVTWETMRSTRDVHPDPFGVNGRKYVHHRYPTEILGFLDECGHDSPNVELLKAFIQKSCPTP